ncbi:MAG: hypothetical protein E6J20_07490 [Chloroflexi bacterium]|nr:MAG: hypothetical protein E6J20_07490 [Chloroflexota bacterium]
MNKRPGHVEVTTEVGYCSFCNRTRNLRREDHHLGTLVRTIVTCETCHRTLSSSIGVAQAEPAAAEKAAEVEAVAEQAPAVAAPKPRRAPAKRAPAKRTAKPAAKAAKPAKPTSTATRKVTKKK